MWVLALWLCRKDSTAFSSQTRTASDAFSDSNPCKITDSKMETIDAGRAICRKFCVFCMYFVLRIWGCQNIKNRPNQIWRNVYSDLTCLESGLYRSWHSPKHLLLSHVSELGSLRWQQWQWSIARYFWQGKGPRIWKFLVTPLCTSILGFQLLSFLVSAEMIQLKDFNTQVVQKPNQQSRDPCWTWFSYTETVQRRALQRNSNM